MFTYLVDGMTSPFLSNLMVSVDVQQLERRKGSPQSQELCESRSGRPGLPVPNSPYKLWT